MSDASPVQFAERGVRCLLMFTIVAGIVGIGADLVLLDHVESATQIIPLGLLAWTLLAIVLHLAMRRAGSVRLLQLTFVMLIACGGLGMYLHFEGNAEFQLEIDPGLSRQELIWKALRAKAPPALAPLSLVQLGLVGLAWAFRHPRVRFKPSAP